LKISTINCFVMLLATLVLPLAQPKLAKADESKTPAHPFIRSAPDAQEANIIEPSALPQKPKYIRLIINSQHQLSGLENGFEIDVDRFEQ
jgi:hypothetical protein